MGKSRRGGPAAPLPPSPLGPSPDLVPAVNPPPEPESVEGALVIGAGPAGLAVAQSLGYQGIPYTVIERADCIASLWKHKTYDRIHLHIPKQHSQLPGMSFPAECPDYPSGSQFIEYLDQYARTFNIIPRFNQTVTEARYVEELGQWRVQAATAGGLVIYHTRWLVVCTGENADPNIPSFRGAANFHGPAVHSSEYRNGEQFRGKKVLVVGSGNSGFEVALDLANHGAKASINVRSPMHVLPRQILGRSTFEVAIWMRGYGAPYFLTDGFLLLYANLSLGDTAKYGIVRPRMGPLERKDVMGVTPVLDVGTLAKIRSGDIKVVRGVMEITRTGAKFADGTTQDFDAIVWATGFKSNVNNWLKDDKTFDIAGMPVKPFPKSWLGHGDRGLYTAGFTRRGLMGVRKDALALAAELKELYKEMCLREQATAFHGRELRIK